MTDAYDRARRRRAIWISLFPGNYDIGVNVTIAKAVAQSDPVNTGPINFTATFSEAASGFTSADVSFAGSTVGGTLAAAVTGGPTVYNIAVTGMTGTGSVNVSIPSGVVTVAKGTTFPPSNTTSVVFDTTRPSVTINQDAGQGDPTGISPILFTVVFSEPVTGFTPSDISFTGSTAGGTLAAAITGGTVIYSVAISGMTTAGNVVASIPANAATDLAGNLSLASTSTDNSVAWDPAAGGGTGQMDFSDPNNSGLLVLLEDI